MRIPLPSCYFAETDSGANLVIDGVQRITTVLRFFQDDFALEGLTVFPELNEKKFSELGPLAADLESTTIRCIVLRRENPDYLISEIFSRLNKGGVALSDQEIRHALYPGKFDDLLQSLSEISLIKNFGVGKKGQSKRDSREGEELVLRYFAFSQSSEDYKDSLTRFLDEFMRKSADFGDKDIENLKLKFQKSLRACEIVFDEDEIFTDIGKSRGRQGVVYYDLLMTTLGELDHKKLSEKRAEIRDAFKKLCASDSFKRSVAGGLQRKSSINRRNRDWKAQLNKAVS